MILQLYCNIIQHQVPFHEVFVDFYIVLLSLPSDQSHNPYVPLWVLHQLTFRIESDLQMMGGYLPK